MNHHKIKKIDNDFDNTLRFSESYKLENINKKMLKKEGQKRLMKEIIAIIESNPKTLENLNVQKLELIDNYYKNQIIEYKKKISNI